MCVLAVIPVSKIITMRPHQVEGVSEYVVILAYLRHPELIDTNAPVPYGGADV